MPDYTALNHWWIWQSLNSSIQYVGCCILCIYDRNTTFPRSPVSVHCQSFWKAKSIRKNPHRKNHMYWLEYMLALYLVHNSRLKIHCNRLRSLEAVVGPRTKAPREATSILKSWLNEHKDNPYPTKSEKMTLSIVTHMTLTQVLYVDILLLCVIQYSTTCQSRSCWIRSLRNINIYFKW